MLLEGMFDGVTVVCATTIVEDVASILDELEPKLLEAAKDEVASDTRLEEVRDVDVVEAVTTLDCCWLTALVLVPPGEAAEA